MNCAAATAAAEYAFQKENERKRQIDQVIEMEIAMKSVFAWCIKSKNTRLSRGNFV